MYKIKHKMVPNYLQDIFINTQEVHNHNIRHREFNYTLPMPNTNAMEKSLGTEVRRLVMLCQLT
jgi:hypothetical protein